MDIWTLQRQSSSSFSSVWVFTTPDRPGTQSGGSLGLLAPGQKAGGSCGKEGFFIPLGGMPLTPLSRLGGPDHSNPCPCNLSFRLL